MRYIRNISDDQNKYGDTDEVFRFNLLQGDDIFNFGSYPISVIIANSSGYILSMTPEKEFGNSVIKLDFNNDLLKSLPPDSYLLEVEVTLPDGTVSKFPTSGGMPFTINKDLKGIQGTLVPTITFDAVLESVDEKIAVYMDTVKVGPKGDTGSSALPVAGVYPTLSALIASSPDNSKVYVTTDNGNWNYWNGTSWVAGGVYQATAIADKSITPRKLLTTDIPNDKSNKSFDTIGGLNTIYIPNEPILSKGIVNVVVKSAPINATIYFLKKTGNNNYKISDFAVATMVEGWQEVKTNFYANGDGDEYIGVVGSTYFNLTGGAGIDWTTAPSPNATSVTTDTSNSNFDFALYLTFENSRIVEEIENNKEIFYKSNPTFLTSDFKIPKYSEISDSVGFVGRWFDKTIGGITTKTTINDGSELYFKVKNTTTINVNFVLNTDNETPQFAYSIDGGQLVRQAIINPLLPTVTNGEHIIRIIADGISAIEDKWVGEKGISFKNVTVDTGGTVTGIIPKNRKIMFYGDSITQGFSVLGTPASANTNSSSNAFPFIASSSLNSISYRVGFAGAGVTKGGSGGIPELSKFIDNMTSARETPSDEPDIVVVNMGTNDTAATSDDFKTKYNAALDRLTIKYSGTPIFAMIPFNQSMSAEISSCVTGRSNIYLVQTQGWNITTVDGIHPDVSGSLVAGNKLSDYIGRVLGKEYFI